VTPVAAILARRPSLRLRGWLTPGDGRCKEVVGSSSDGYMPTTVKDAAEENLKTGRHVVILQRIFSCGVE